MNYLKLFSITLNSVINSSNWNSKIRNKFWTLRKPISIGSEIFKGSQYSFSIIPSLFF